MRIFLILDLQYCVLKSQCKISDMYEILFYVFLNGFVCLFGFGIFTTYIMQLVNYWYEKFSRTGS